MINIKQIEIFIIKNIDNIVSILKDHETIRIFVKFREYENLNLFIQQLSLRKQSSFSLLLFA